MLYRATLYVKARSKTGDYKDGMKIALCISNITISSPTECGVMLIFQHRSKTDFFFFLERNREMITAGQTIADLLIQGSATEREVPPAIMRAIEQRGSILELPLYDIPINLEQVPTYRNYFKIFGLRLHG